MVVLLLFIYVMLRSVDREKLNMNERMLSELDINVNYEKMCVRDKWFSYIDRNKLFIYRFFGNSV